MKVKQVSLDGWSITKGSFINESLGCTLYAKSFKDFTLKISTMWILKQEGYKTTSFSSYFEAIRKVHLREVEKRLQLGNDSINAKLYSNISTTLQN